jgi:hypothetical protein
MKKNILITCLSVISLTACTTGTDFTGRPVMTTPKTQIKVGESITITVTKFGGVFQGAKELTFKTQSFIYSAKTQPSLETPAPYAPLAEGGFRADTLPSLFPVKSEIEITTPTTSDDNVPIPIDTTVENNVVRAFFTIKGKSVGTITIKTGFLVNSLEYPNNYVRIPAFPDFDGEITIQVVP